MTDRSTSCVAWPGVSLAMLWLLAGCTNDNAMGDLPGVASEPVQGLDPYAQSPSRFGVVPLHAGFSPDPRVVGGISTGEVPASSVHRKCAGWISEAPDYLLDCETAFLQLNVFARSRQDVLLVVRTPDGTVLCNDNRKGTRDPLIRGSFPMGNTQVWVGVHEQGATASYRLGFSELKWQSSSIPLPDD
ncbi:MAG TPA: hypothetical protein VLS88_15930 [Polyangiales bacterium]|nr:hypothetical protein [Polyangiales bacterium]